MAGQIKCPHCGQTYGLTDEQVPQYAGWTITCRQCKQEIGVPLPAAASARPSAQQAQPGGASPEQPHRIEPIDYASPDHQPKQANQRAANSVVWGVVGFVIPIIPSLVGIITGILGLRNTRDPRIGGKAMAITGITLSCISMVIGCIVAETILNPPMGRSRETANRVKCAANMKSIGQAMLLYANGNGGAFPMQLQDLITTQDITAECFICPSGSDTVATGATTAAIAQALTSGGHLSYIYFGKGLNTSASATTILLCEPLVNHNNDGINFLFGDGSTQFIMGPQARSMIAQLQAGTNPPK